MPDTPSPEPTSAPDAAAAGATPLPLVFDEPRGRKKPPRHLADLTPDERDAARRGARPARLPRQAARRTHYFARLVDDPAEMTDLPAAQRDELVAGAAAAADDAAAHDGGRPGHHPQDAVEALRRRARRVGPDALPRPRHHVRLEPGRLRHGLPVLRDRPGRPAAQHVDRRDRRAGRRRCAVAGARRGPRRAGPGLQRRLHGHGRAAGQLQGRDRRRPPAHRPAPDGPRACPRAASPSRPSAWCRGSASSPTRASRSRWRCRCTRPTTSCATSWSRSTPAGRSPRPSRPPGTTRG